MTTADRARQLLAAALRRSPDDRPATLDADAARQALDADLIRMRGDANKAPTPTQAKP